MAAGLTSDEAALDRLRATIALRFTDRDREAADATIAEAAEAVEVLTGRPPEMSTIQKVANSNLRRAE